MDDLINIQYQDTDFRLDCREGLDVWIERLVLDKGFTLGEIGIVFCSDEYLLSLNKTYLKHHYYTDIITFNYNEEDIISGDLCISIERVRENAHRYEVELCNEIDRVIVHGVLHLCGYDDKSPDDKALMTKKEDYYLSLRPW